MNFRWLRLWAASLVFLVFAAPLRAADSTASRPPAKDQPAQATPETGGEAPRSGGKEKGVAFSPSPAKSPPTQSSGRKSKLPRMVIVVTPTKIPEPVGQVGTTTSVVTQNEIRQQGIRSVGDALRQVPGVQITQSGSPGTVTDMSIRGSTPAQTLMMIDGVPVNDSATDQFDISRLTTNDLNRIEVVRGAGGALYGSQAIGGVVNLITEEGSGPMKFSLLSEGGNRATQFQALNFNGAEGKLAMCGALTYYSTEGYRRLNDNSDDLTGSVRLDYHLNEDTTVRGFARYIRANVSLATFSESSGIPLNPTAHQRNEFMLYKGEIDHHFGERLLARLSAFYVRDQVRLNSVPFTGNPMSERDNIPDETRGSMLDVLYTWSDSFRSLAGFEFLDRWAHSASDLVFYSPPPPLGFLTVFNARRQEYAGYVEQQANLFHDHLFLTGGVRVDGNSQFGKEVSPAWSVAIPLNHYGLTFRGSYSEGFRAPSFDELYFPGFGNPQLAPEISSEYDGGFTKTFGEMISLTTTYFSRRVHHMIVTVPAPGTEFGSTAGNAGRVDTQGVEIVPAISPLRGLEFSGNVTILDQTHHAPLPNDRPLRVPKYSAAALTRYDRTSLLRAGDGGSIALAYIFVGDRDDITPAGGIANHIGYHRFDLSLAYSPGLQFGVIRGEHFEARIQNLLDRHYSEVIGFPSPAVNFLAGVRVDF